MASICNEAPTQNLYGRVICRVREKGNVFALNLLPHELSAWRGLFNMARNYNAYSLAFLVFPDGRRERLA